MFASKQGTVIAKGLKIVASVTAEVDLLGGGSGVAGYTVRCADGVARANTPTRSSLGSNVCFGSLADLTSLARNVRFILESRNARRRHQC
jgi:hypothetical protein